MLNPRELSFRGDGSNDKSLDFSLFPFDIYFMYL